MSSFMPDPARHSNLRHIVSLIKLRIVNGCTRVCRFVFLYTFSITINFEQSLTIHRGEVSLSTAAAAIAKHKDKNIFTANRIAN